MTESEAVEGEFDYEKILAELDIKFEASSQEGINACPLENFSSREIAAIRRKLLERGFNIDKLSEEEKDSLKESQFRGKPGHVEYLSQGRGPGISAVMGRENAEGLLSFSYETAIALGWQNHKIGGHDGTQGRGIQQAVADIISLAVFGAQDQKRFIVSLNQRLLKGLKSKNKDPQVQDIIAKNFWEVDEARDWSSLASTPPGALIHIWRYLAG